MADVERYRALLAPVERAAREQPWAKDRPWRVSTHVAWDGAMPLVDLHDLKAALAREAVRLVLSDPPEAGAVVFVHGRGRHTVGPGGVLRDVVAKELQHACRQTPSWSFRPMGPARWVWISDWKRAPSSVTGGNTGWTWLLLVLAAILIGWAIGREIGVW